MSRAEREAQFVAAWLARRGLERAGSSSYGRGEHWINVPVPPESRNGRQRCQVLVRRLA